MKTPKGGSVYDEKGLQYCDPTPVEMPLGYSPPEDISAMVARLCAMEDFRRQQAAQGNDTFEEADDFEVDDEEPLAFVGHEFTEMSEEILREEARKAADEEVDRILAKRGTQPPGAAPATPTATQGPSGQSVSTT